MKNIIIGMVFLLIIKPSFSQNTEANQYDVKQYILDLQISNLSTNISGSVIFNAVVVSDSLNLFICDLIDTIAVGKTYMVVDSVLINGENSNFQHYNDSVFVYLKNPIFSSEHFISQIFYHGNGGMSELTYYDGIDNLKYCNIQHTKSSSEPYGAKIWWPCKQDLQDKADSVIFYITTESTNVSGSNGILKFTELLQNGKVKYKWVSNYPVAYYLISFVVGPFEVYNTYMHLQDNEDSLLLQNLLFPESAQYDLHIKAINKTKQLLCFYSNLFGNYPFIDEKYGYCIVGDEFGAMENQTMCTIGYGYIDTTSRLYFGGNSWIIAHELAHQWFGNYVTCSTWNDLWLSEGFASYVEFIALEFFDMKAESKNWIKNAQARAKSATEGSVFIEDKDLLNQNLMFDSSLRYKKGACILHTLRYEINNDSLFFLILKKYLNGYAHSTACTNDFIKIAEETTGMDFTTFFNQWYYGKGFPNFYLNWSRNYDTLIINSIQKGSSVSTPFFKTHFDIKLKFPDGDTTLRLYQDTSYKIFKIKVIHPVTNIIIDPNNWLIQNNSVINHLNELGIDDDFEVYPNPADDKIIIEAKRLRLDNRFSVKIFDVLGNLCFEHVETNSKIQIDVLKLHAGIYIVKIENSNIQKAYKVFKN